MSEAINEPMFEPTFEPDGATINAPQRASSPTEGPKGLFGRLCSALFPGKRPGSSHASNPTDTNVTVPKAGKETLEIRSDRECGSKPDSAPDTAIDPAQPLCIRHLSKRFPAPDGKVLEALSDVSIDIFRRGENVAIVGPDPHSYDCGTLEARRT